MMRKIIYFLFLNCFLVSAGSVFAQDASNSSRTGQRTPNQEFLIEAKGSKFEVIQDRRAHTTEKHGNFERATASVDEAFNRKNLGIIIDHNIGVEVATTGEITFKLKNGVNQDIISSLMLPNVILVMKPDIFVVKTSTPRQLVMIARKLNASPVVEWAEPYTIHGNIR